MSGGYKKPETLFKTGIASYNTCITRHAYLLISLKSIFAFLL